MKTIFLSLILSMVSLTLVAQDFYNLVKQAQNAVQKNDFDQAKILYEQSLLKKPDDAITHYNLGRVLYRLGEFEKAQEHFEKALMTQNPALERDVRKNLGNTHVQQSRQNISNPQVAIDQLQKALNSFNEAGSISLEQKDPDIIFNQQLTENLIKKIQEMMPPQSSQDQQNNQDQNQDEQQNNQQNQHSQNNQNEQHQQSDQQSPSQKEQQAQQNQTQAQNTQNNQNQQQQDNAQQNSSQTLPLNEKEIEALLRQARLHERQRQQELEKRKQQQKATSQVDKDW